MGRILVGSIVAAVVAFVFGFVFWVVLPFHFDAIEPLPGGWVIGPGKKQ